MPLVACLECGALAPKTKFGRCETHAKAWMMQRQKNRRGEGAKYNAPGWRGLSMRMRAEQPWCSKCGTQGSSNNPLTLDHLIPLAAGGKLVPDEDGVQVLCRRCNTSEGSTTHERGKLST
jgi:5-methylcytosine-specific restriction endonuclease McrA